MSLAVDVDYREGYASVAGITFENWEDSKVSRIFRSKYHPTAEYVPGELFRRELPCIMQLIGEHNLHPDIIIVDGFVYLDGKSKPGLGKHLYDALDKEVVVIGVAKKPFQGIGHKYGVYRGKSKTPLYVTSVGMELDEAKQSIQTMYGKYRIPVMLKKVDQTSRESA